MKLASAIMDRLNPVVVRESRQLVRSRFAVGIIMLFMLIMVVVSGIYVVNMGGKSYRAFSHGKELFEILFYVMGYIAILFVPTHTAQPLLMQKQSTSMDLLFVSTIPPRSIIWGKMVSAFWMMVLLFSVSMPFMMMTVLLRGIGLFEVFTYLIVMAGLVMLATAGFVLLVCLPATRVLLGMLSIAYFMMLFIFPGIVSSIFRYSNVDTRALYTFLLITAILLPILGAMATALVSPPISNRAFGARITVTVCWIIAGIGAALAKRDAMEVWLTITVFGLVAAMMICSSDPSEASRRVRRAIPRNPLLRLLARPFFNGPLNGWIWCLLIGAVTVWASRDVDKVPEFASVLLYGLAYCLMAAFLRRKTFIHRFCAEKYTWAIALVLLIFGCILPLIAHFAVDPESRPDLLWRMGNPFSAFDRDAGKHLMFAACMCGLFILLNFRWLGAQLTLFQPLEATNPSNRDE